MVQILRGHGAERDAARYLFCGHAILGDGAFVIPDALQDERFATTPGRRPTACAVLCGLPLRGPGGRKLGTLCIIDSKPRAFSDEDVEMLVDLALMVEREFSAIEWATVDELTGLSNRRGFMMLAQHSLQLCTRQNIPAALVFIDLDHLKQVNDQLGHAEGDWVLVTFAQHLMKAFRGSDVVARLGGDEFLVLLTNHSEAAAESAMARLQQALDATNEAEARGYDISFSHGLVEFDPKRHHHDWRLDQRGRFADVQNQTARR